MSVTKASYRVLLIVLRDGKPSIYFLEVDEGTYLTFVGCTRSTQHPGGWFDNYIEGFKPFWNGEEMSPISSTCYPMVVRVQ